ncbi:MAG: hypothetical protein C0407_11365 [Desulfobacca sp.]|nr:hypothetical protein [Desulfobacca sp.]
MKNLLTEIFNYYKFSAMETEEKKSKPDTSQDWLIISIVFWITFVLIVTIGYLVNPNYTPPIKP